MSDCMYVGVNVCECVCVQQLALAVHATDMRTFAAAAADDSDDDELLLLLLMMMLRLLLLLMLRLLLILLLPLLPRICYCCREGGE